MIGSQLVICNWTWFVVSFVWETIFVSETIGVLEVVSTSPTLFPTLRPTAISPKGFARSFSLSPQFISTFSSPFSDFTGFAPFYFCYHLFLHFPALFGFGQYVWVSPQFTSILPSFFLDFAGFVQSFTTADFLSLFLWSKQKSAAPNLLRIISKLLFLTCWYCVSKLRSPQVFIRFFMNSSPSQLLSDLCDILQ